jgi:hypothetical protein
MMLAANEPSMSAKNNNTKFAAPQMVTKSPNTFGGFGFGASL